MIENHIENLEIKKVGKFYENPKRPFSYIDIDYEKGKWADCSKYLPSEFDLCHCKIENTETILPGWYTGMGWDGCNIKPAHKIIKWKLNYDI